jgi:hypothetical protein
VARREFILGFEVVYSFQGSIHWIVHNAYVHTVNVNIFSFMNGIYDFFGLIFKIIFREKTSSLIAQII